MKRKRKLEESKSTLLILVAMGLFIGLFFISQSTTGLTVDTPEYVPQSLSLVGWLILSCSLVFAYFLISKKTEN